MPDETQIKDLDPLVPGGGANISGGDDEIRGIKGALNGSFQGFEGSTSTVVKTVTKTEDEINDLAEKSAGTFGTPQTISGYWEFTAEVRIQRDAGRGLTMYNDAVVGGYKADENTFVPLVYVSDVGNGEKAVFGGTNAESQYEGDPHTFLGDVTVLAGISSPGNFSSIGSVTASTNVNAQTGDVNAPAGKVVAPEVSIGTKLSHGNVLGVGATLLVNGSIEVFDGTGTPFNPRKWIRLYEGVPP